VGGVSSAVAPLFLFLNQLRQLGDVRRNPPRFVFREWRQAERIVKPDFCEDCLSRGTSCEHDRGLLHSGVGEKQRSTLVVADSVRVKLNYVTDRWIRRGEIPQCQSPYDAQNRNQSNSFWTS
jgi:hypothetical protein